jgi:hypothetical protein
MEMGVFSMWFMQKSYLEDSLGYPVSCQLNSAWEAVKIGPEGVKLKNLHC